MSPPQPLHKPRPIHLSRDIKRVKRQILNTPPNIRGIPRGKQELHRVDPLQIHTANALAEPGGEAGIAEGEGVGAVEDGEGFRGDLAVHEEKGGGDVGDGGVVEDIEGDLDGALVVVRGYAAVAREGGEGEDRGADFTGEGEEGVFAGLGRRGAATVGEGWGDAGAAGAAGVVSVFVCGKWVREGV